MKDTYPISLRSILIFGWALNGILTPGLASEWDGPLNGDWFDPANWTVGVPDLSEDAVVFGDSSILVMGNGETAQARDLLLSTANSASVDVIDFTNVNLSISRDVVLGGSRGGNDATLRLRAGGAAGGDLTVDNVVLIGDNNASASGSNELKGTLDIDGDLEFTGTASSLTVGRTLSPSNTPGNGSANIGGAISGINSLFRVGSVESSTANATGALTVGEGISDSADFLLVGRTSGSGDADGTLNVLSGGYAAGLGSIRVGETIGSGNAVGFAEINGGVIQVGSLLVGEASDSGSADGTLIVTGGELRALPFAGGGTQNLNVGESNASALGSSTATGRLTVSGNLAGFKDGFDVGTAFGEGSAQGSVDVGGELNLANVSFARIGMAGDSSSGTGLIDGTVTVGAGIRSAGSILVGTTFTGRSAVGELTVDSGGIGGTGLLEVGVVQQDAGATGLAEGTLTVTGDVSGFSSAMRVGVAKSGSSASASGTAQIDGAVNLGSDETMQVGVAEGAGDATGSLTITSGGLTAGNLRVGFSEDAGVSNGSLEITGGDLRANPGTGGSNDQRFITVGTSSSSALAASSATGSLTVSGDLAGFKDNFDVGTAFGEGSAQGSVDVGGQLDLANASFARIGMATSSSTGTGPIEGIVTVGTGIQNAGSFLVGTTFSGRSAVGELTVDSGGIGGTGLLEVGVVQQDAAATGLAEGTLTVTGAVSGFSSAMRVGVAESGSSASASGTALIAGAVDVGSDETMQVGVAEGAGDATGSLSVTSGGLTAGDLQVGVSEDAGNSTGSLQVAGGASLGLLEVGVATGTGTADGSATLVGDASMVDVNVGSPFGAGNAKGSLTLRDGNVSVSGGFVIVGDVFGFGSGGVPNGRLALENALLDTDSTMALGDGSTLAIQFNGLARGTEFGAIDAADFGVAGGDLELDFQFLPTVGDQFDLVRLDFPGSTIVGSFQNVTTAGLPEGLEVALNRHSDDPNFGEILELSIVPEPGYGGLVFAVFTWSVLLRRRRLPGRSRGFHLAKGGRRALEDRAITDFDT